MCSVNDLERIRVNDPSLEEVELYCGLRQPPTGASDSTFEALRDNTVVKSLSVNLDDDKGKLDKASRLAFAEMLSKNNTILKVSLKLWSKLRPGLPCLELEPFMNVLTEHGEGICLKRFVIVDYGYEYEYSTGGFLRGVVEFLTRWPQAVKKLELDASKDVKSPLAEQVLKGIASTQIESLSLGQFSGWYDEYDVAAAMEQPCFRLKELLMTCPREASRRYLDALNSNTSITSLHMYVKIHRPVEEAPLPNLVHLLPSLENIQKLSLEGLFSADLGSVCLAVRRHGNIKSLKLSCKVVDQEEPVEDVTTTFVPAVFQGLEEFDFEMYLFSHVDLDDWLETTGSAFNAICSSLRNNPTIQKVALTFGNLPMNVFSSLTEAAIPTMPNLHVLDLDCDLIKEEHASMFLAATKKYKNLHKVSLKQDTFIRNPPSKWIRGEINRHCEMNRIDYPKLLAADDKSVPLALWPNIMAKVCQVDVRFELLCEKNDVMLINLPRQCGTKRSAASKDSETKSK